LTLAIHPIHDKDGQSAKNKSELSESHLWLRESVELRALRRRLARNCVGDVWKYGLKEETVPNARGLRDRDTSKQTCEDVEDIVKIKTT
jgi:hypothetical protein